MADNERIVANEMNVASEMEEESIKGILFKFKFFIFFKFFSNLKNSINCLPISETQQNVMNAKQSSGGSVPILLACGST